MNQVNFNKTVAKLIGITHLHNGKLRYSDYLETINTSAKLIASLLKSP